MGFKQKVRGEKKSCLDLVILRQDLTANEEPALTESRGGLGWKGH